jgi:hypothetical protein
MMVLGQVYLLPVTYQPSKYKEQRYCTVHHTVNVLPPVVLKIQILVILTFDNAQKKARKIFCLGLKVEEKAKLYFYNKM